MRLNLDKVTHPIHCYYPASGKKYFDRLRYGTIYHEIINVVEHPVSEAGLVEDDGKFRIEATFLEHGVDNIGWRITEPDVRKFDEAGLRSEGIRGLLVRELIEKGSVVVNGKKVGIEDLTHFTARYQNPKDFEREAKEVFPNVFIAEDFKSFPFEK